MYYLVRCPICACSETEKLKDINFVGFKCCECGYEFSATEAMFGQIDDYEINETIELPQPKPIKIKSKLCKAGKIIKKIE